MSPPTNTPLKILVVGAGVAGPAFASLLLRSDRLCDIKIIERGPELRLSGAQIDVKSQAVPVLKKMQLLDDVRASTVHETGLEMVDVSDKTLACFGVTGADKRSITLTSEFEIMRADLVNILYKDSLKQRDMALQRGLRSQLTYEFGKSVTEISQTDNGAEVTFSDGEKQSFDLVVAADGQGSRTRALAFDPDVSKEAFKPINIHSAYFHMPRVKGEGGLARGCYHEGRLFFTRTSDRPVTGAYLFTKLNQDQLKVSYRESIEEQKQVWSEVVKGSKWQEERFLQGLRECTDFYAHEQGQVKMPVLHQERVVLLGDAGYCPSPFTGLGTTLALAGAYVLAGELARHRDDIDTAFARHETKLRPLIDECQQLPFGGLDWMFPESRLGAWILRIGIWAVSAFKIDRIISSWMTSDKTKGGFGWGVPDYPELNLG